MNCTPEAIASASRCFCGFSRKESEAADIYLLCQWANAGPGFLFNWVPGTQLGIWSDDTGSHTTDYPTFAATAHRTLVTSLDFDSDPITELNNLDDLPALTFLRISNCLFLPAVDFSGCTNLQIIRGTSCGLINVDVSGLTNLTELILPLSANLVSVNATGCTSLQGDPLHLLLAGCPNLNTVNLTNCTAITTLNFNPTPSLQILTILGCTSLATLDCSNCDIQPGLDCTNLTALTTLTCSGNANLTTLTLTGCTGLVTLDCNSCDITGTLDVSPAGAALTTLNCSANANLTTLTLTGCTGLVTLDCNSCNITGILNLSSCSSLDTCDCSVNPLLTGITFNALSVITVLTANDCSIGGVFNVTPCSILQTLNCSSNPLTNLTLTGLTSLQTLSVSSCAVNGTLNASPCTNLFSLFADTNASMTGLNIGNSTNYINVSAAACGLNQASVDDVLAKLVANALANAGTVNMSGGTSSGPTNDCNVGTDCDTLTSNGWTVNTN